MARESQESIVSMKPARTTPAATRGAERDTPGGLEERIFRGLLVATDLLLRGEIEVLRLADLTFPQYNVLRILRGARPDGLSCGTISERMVTRDSDLTRLLDRLEERGLVERSRDDADRRVVLAQVSDEGMKVLKKLDGPVERVHREQLKHLTRAQLDTLRGLLDAVPGTGR